MPSVANGQLANPVKRQRPKHRHQIRLAATSKTNWVSDAKKKKKNKRPFTHYRLFCFCFFVPPTFLLVGPNMLNAAASNRSSILLVEGIKNHENCTCGYHSSQNDGITPFANICSLD